MLLWILTIPLVLFALVLVLLGLRGRAVDDHPVCRRCRFDLIGTAISDGARCPECGASLQTPAAIRTGNRARRGRLITVGLLLLAFTAAGAGGVAWSARKGFNWNTVKPTWMLVGEARGPDPVASPTALTELLTRLDKGRVSASTRDALVQAALARQGDAVLPWDPQWGDLVERARKDGKLSDADWAGYLRGMIDLYVSARPVVRQGDDLVAHAGPAFRGASKSLVACRAVLTDIRLNDTPVSGPPGTFVLEAVCSSTFGGISGTRAAFEHPLVTTDIGMPRDAWSEDSNARRRLRADVPPGDYTLKTTWVLTIGAPAAAMGPGGVSGSSTWTTYSWGERTSTAPLAALFGMGKVDQPREPDMAERLMRGEAVTFSGGPSQVPPFVEGDERQVKLITRECRVQVVAPETANVELVTDRSLRDQMQQAIKIEVGPSLYNQRDGVVAVISFTRPPVDGAFDVCQRTARGERRLGCVVGRRDSQGAAAEFPLQGPKGSDPSYDLVLRPSVETARKTRDVTRIWGLEVEFGGLKATSKQPASNGSSEQLPAEPVVAPADAG